MSEKKKTSKKSGASAVVATVIVALAAVVAIVALLMMNKSPSENQELPDGTVVTFKPTQELIDECGAKAQQLISDNYRIVRLFITEGLPYQEEPYGNRPEDGAYTVNSDEYKTYEQMENYVNSVFVEEEAHRILTHMPSDPAAMYSSDTSSDVSQNTSGSGSGSEYISVYTSRVAYVDIPVESSEVSLPKVPDIVVPEQSSGDEESSSVASKPSAPTYTKESVLGISENFKPYTAYNKPWNSISIKIIPTSEEECHVTVYLGADKDINLSSVGESDILNTEMVKENGEWRLTQLVF